MLTHETYITAVSVIVFILFVLVFSYAIGAIQRLTAALVRLGGMDDKVLCTMTRKRRNENSLLAKIGRVFGNVISFVLMIFFLAALLISLSAKDWPDSATGPIPTLKVILSGSMAKANEKNTYIEQHGLDDQFDSYDLLVIRELPVPDTIAVCGSYSAQLRAPACKGDQKALVRL